MTNKELELKLQSMIDNTRPFNELHNLFIQFRDEGGSQEDAYSACIKLLKELRDKEENEENEIKWNLLNDIADFVSGFCSPHNRIWN